jgi:hypothetical protein
MYRRFDREKLIGAPSAAVAVTPRRDAIAAELAESSIAPVVRGVAESRHPAANAPCVGTAQSGCCDRIPRQALCRHPPVRPIDV